MTTSLKQTQESGNADIGPEESTNFWSILKNRYFLLLWMAQLISLTVLNATSYGFIVLIGKTTQSPILAGLAIIAFQLPAFPFGAVAGVIVDWFDKRLILWLSNLLRVFTMLLMCVSIFIDQTNLTPLFILVFITALIGQFFTPAEGAAIPLLVARRELMLALSLFNMTMTLSLVLGFLFLGGFLVVILPAFTLNIGELILHIEPTTILFALGALLYAVCAVLILCIPARAFKLEQMDSPRSKEAYGELKAALHKLWCDMVEGWQIVRSSRLLFFSVIQLSLAGILMLLIGGQAITFVEQVLGRRPEETSLVLAPAGVGLVGASLLVPRISKYISKLRLTVIGLLLLAVGFLLLLGSQRLAVYLDPVHGMESGLLLGVTIIWICLLGAGIALVNVPTQTIMLELAPEAGRARVISLQLMCYSLGSIPVLLGAAAVTQFLGFDRFILLLSTSLLLFCWWGRWFVRKSLKIS